MWKLYCLSLYLHEHFMSVVIIVVRYLIQREPMQMHQITDIIFNCKMCLNLLILHIHLPFDCTLLL